MKYIFKFYYHMIFYFRSQPSVKFDFSPFIVKSLGTSDMEPL